MTWSTIEEAWGNEPKEEFNNYYENYQTNTIQKQQTNTIQKQQTQVPSTQVPSTQVPSKQVPSKQVPYNDIKNKNKLLDDKINRLEIQITTNNLSINKKLDNLTLKIETEIKRVNTEVIKLVETLKNDNSENTNVDNFSQNMNDIILFVIFGVFMIILMDSMYRILLLKIKKI